MCIRTGCYVITYRVLCAYVQGVMCIRTGCYVHTYRVLCAYVQGVVCILQGVMCICTGCYVYTYRVLCAYVQGVMCIRTWCYVHTYTTAVGCVFFQTYEPALTSLHSVPVARDSYAYDQFLKGVLEILALVENSYRPSGMW